MNYSQCHLSAQQDHGEDPCGNHARACGGQGVD